MRWRRLWAARGTAADPKAARSATIQRMGRVRLGVAVRDRRRSRGRRVARAVGLVTAGASHRAAAKAGGQARAVPEARSAAAAALRDDRGAVRARRPVARHDAGPVRGPPPRRHRLAREAADLRRRGRAGLRLDRQRPLLHPHVRAGAPAPRPGAGRHARHRALAGDQLPQASEGRTAPIARASAQCARILGDHYDVLSDLGRRRRHRRRTRARSGSIGSTSTAIRTAPSSPSHTPTATATRSPRWSSTAPIRSAARARGTRACGRTASGRLQIACNRTAACSGNAYRRLGAVVAQLRRTPRGVGPLLDAIASGGYEPPAAQLPQIDEAISAYLHGNRRPYKRLTEADPGPYGIYRAYSRGDELAVSCNDYPMLWDKRAGEAERRRQLHAAVRKYPQGAFKPFTPREVALESVAGYTRVPGVAEAEPALRAPGAAGRAAAADANAGDLGRARQRHQPGRGGVPSPTTSPTPGCGSPATAATCPRSTAAATRPATGCGGSSSATAAAAGLGRPAR